MADDLHTHVASDLGLDGPVRTMVASGFGLVGSLPHVVGTGCGLQVPRVDTARRPEDVTCLPCRQYARQRYLEHAQAIDRLVGVSGTGTDPEQLRQAADAARDLARRFATDDEEP
ncbi:hypothetical protein GC722_01245 [Auraticoccus sp. F435]|uniref:Uncharacterized protein n=1 Tax=Auraticoccus cholistanensis TaxID=2656650 RepID=A0A6A9USW5_9ACTN|nr:hypothetical protein [Auraticoccus cholistanensis]